MKLYSGERTEKMSVVFPELKDFRVAVVAKSLCRVRGSNPDERMDGGIKGLHGLSWHVGTNEYDEPFVCRWMYQINSALKVLSDLDSLTKGANPQPASDAATHPLVVPALSPAYVSAAIDALAQQKDEGVKEFRVAYAVAQRQTNLGARIFDMTTATLASMRAVIAAGQVEMLLFLSGQIKDARLNSRIASDVYGNCIEKGVINDGP